MKILPALLGAALLFSPTASAKPNVDPGPLCPRVEVVFARGTNDSPGAGEVGNAFIAALSARLPGVDSYGVNYPASMDWKGSAVAGVTDAATFTINLAHRCPKTRIVLGGYSQGAAVAGFVTSDSVPEGVDIGVQPQPWLADHVAAVVLFGLPNPSFSGMLGVPPVSMGGRYQGKVLQLCTPGDPVCDGGSDFALHTQYAENGSIQQGVDFVLAHL